jgi:hypothetical protein
MGYISSRVLPESQDYDPLKRETVSYSVLPFGSLLYFYYIEGSKSLPAMG